MNWLINNEHFLFVIINLHLLFMFTFKLTNHEKFILYFFINPFNAVYFFG